MALERLTKDNFVDHPPFFPVYDYWYNELVDAFNAMVPAVGAAQADIISESTADAGVTVEGVLIKDSTVDLNGVADSLIIDADGDTTISAPTDDQIDIEIAGADDFTFTANTFTALSGSTIKTNTIAETTGGSGVTADGVLLKDGAVTASAMLLATTLGTVASNVATYEYSNGRHVTTVLSFTGLILGTPNAGNNSAHGILLHTLSTTAITHVIKSISVQVGLTVGTVTTDTPDVGLGTEIATGAVATLDGTPAFEDIITGQTWDKALDGTVDHFAFLPGGGIATEATVVPIINAAGSATAIYLNVAGGWNAGVTGNLTASGIVVIEYIIMTA